ncbi:WD40/YVTN/BNR-like repeat-containing protein [Cupriavidus lacunae]|uniref:Glycosyl hydrolase n=1 Tax=Cupriavidus lacunae TaxID=2666307 RepID=A0A370NWY2_9BURK|nr:YCF48-related protein [Cupriavidus lacunae]RDK10112.1 glycosyl hydrolase [Cupriavidus lacunae]
MYPAIRIGLAAATLLGAQLASAAPNVFLDPLDQPARMSVNAERAMLVGATRTPDGRLVVVGRRGVVLTSDDNGAHWKQAKVPVSTDLLAVNFPTATQGWAVGHAGVVLHTHDGGLTWERQLDGRTLPDLLIKHSKPAADAGDERARRDLQEAELFKADGPGRPLFDVRFTDATHGIAIGAYNLALRTDDGGRNWHPIGEQIDNPQNMHLYGLASAAGTLWIAGEQGLVLKQDPATGRFERVATPYPGTFFGIAGNGDDVAVFGLRGNALRSRDAGKSWERLDTGTQSNLTGGIFLAGGRLILTSAAGELLEAGAATNKMNRLAQGSPVPVFGVSKTRDGQLLLTGAHGVRVVAPGAAGQPVATVAGAMSAGNSIKSE